MIRAAPTLTHALSHLTNTEADDSRHEEAVTSLLQTVLFVLDAILLILF